MQTPQESATSLEERLLASEEHFRLLVENVREHAIFMLDPEGTVVTWNTGAERLKGYTAAEIVGRHFSTFYPDDEARTGKAARELEVSATEGVFEEEGWRVRKDGSRFWANVVLTSIRDGDGTLRGFAKITRDLTERRRLEEERIRRAQAEEAIRLREQFLSIASHELRTPLTALQLQLEGMLSRLGESEARSRVRIERALRSGERLGELVDTLLDVSRLRTGHMPVHLQPVDLSAVITDVAERFAAMAEKGGCEIRTEVVAGLEGKCDRLRIEQVVMNLLSNAAKFGAGQPITLRLAQEGSDGVLRVADRGPGIAEEDLERIFGKFERSASTIHHGGLGLGLYVAREIATRHGGSVAAENLPGGGACFTLRLPLGGPATEREGS